MTSKTGLVMDAQRILISSRAAGTTDIVMQVSVPETTADYGVLVPVPSEPTLDTEAVDSAELRSLDELTAPRLLINSDSGSGSSPGCGCGAGADDDAGGVPTRGVSVSKPVEIGPVTAVSLTGDDASAVRAWLDDNGFTLTDEDAATLATYVATGSYFIAIRRAETALTGGPTSIGLHYTLNDDHRKVSLGFARIGAASSVAFTVFIAAPTAIGPSSPFVALTLDDLDVQALRTGSYSSAVEQAVAKHDSMAFVLERSIASSSLTQTPRLAALIDGNAIVTRATTVVAREALEQDAVFAAPFSKAIPSMRIAGRRVPRATLASLGPLGLLLVAGLRRRKRRRALLVP